MALIALAAGKGAPGVTTSAVALAAVWPRPALLVECDAAGGDVAYRLEAAGHTPLAQDRGVLSLAAALRTGHQVNVTDHVQYLAGGLPVLVGPASSGQAAVLSSVWPAVVDSLTGHGGGEVFVDCGRLTVDAPAVAVLERADCTVLVVRAAGSAAQDAHRLGERRKVVDGVAHLRHAVEVAVVASSGPVGVLVVGDPRRDEAEVQEVLDGAGLPARVVGVLAYDGQGAAGLRGEWTRRLDKTPLITSAREVAHRLDAWLLAMSATVDRAEAVL
jgi:hypothetical protein